MRSVKTNSNVNLYDAARRESGFLPARILPRPLRQAYRYFAKVVEGQAILPRHIGSTFCVTFLGATLFYGASLGGHLDGALSTSSAQIGLSVDAINITGAVRTREDQVLAALNLDENASIISLDVAEARTKIMAMPWIASVAVAKAYPDAVRVDLTEKTAHAIWQNGLEVVALDEKGAIIGPASLAADRSLPAFVGRGADKVGLKFAAHLKEMVPDIASSIRAHVLVAERRWDLVLNSDVVVRLPESGIDAAMVQLRTLNNEKNLLARDVTSVDLRIADRVTLGLGAVAQEALADNIKVEDKEASKS